MRILSVLFLVCSTIAKTYGQGADTLPEKDSYAGCIKPAMLTTHPFGLFVSRIDHHFTTAPPEKMRLCFDMASGNVWLPPVIELMPRDPATVAYLAGLPWHKRQYAYMEMPQNHDSMYVSADGVIKTFRLSMDFRITKQSELDIEVRSFLLTGGSGPFTFFTSDAFIESFHRNLWDGRDVFARGSYPYNQAEIDLYDRKGRSIHLKAGDFLIPGIQLTWYYYPQVSFFKKHGFSVNAGVHAGINTSIYNPGIDLGISGMLQKRFVVGKLQRINLAFAGSVLRQKLISLGTGVEFSTNNYLPAFESQMEYRKYTGDMKRFWAISGNFYLLGPYKNSKELDYITPEGNRYSPHWHMAYSHPYHNLQNWTLIWSIGNSRSVVSFYIKEDLKVDNAPDLQTGISAQILLGRVN